MNGCGKIDSICFYTPFWMSVIIACALCRKLYLILVLLLYTKTVVFCVSGTFRANRVPWCHTWKICCMFSPPLLCVFLWRLLSTYLMHDGTRQERVGVRWVRGLVGSLLYSNRHFFEPQGPGAEVIEKHVTLPMMDIIFHSALRNSMESAESLTRHACVFCVGVCTRTLSIYE